MAYHLLYSSDNVQRLTLIRMYNPDMVVRAHEDHTFLQDFGGEDTEYELVEIEFNSDGVFDFGWGASNRKNDGKAD